MHRLLYRLIFILLLTACTRPSSGQEEPQANIMPLDQAEQISSETPVPSIMSASQNDISMTPIISATDDISLHTSMPKLEKTPMAPATLEVKKTPTKTPIIERLFSIDYGTAYQRHDVNERYVEYSPPIDWAPNFDGTLEDEVGPGDAYVLAFAYFQETMAYWIADEEGGQLWMSDLAYQNPKRIFTDTAGIYPTDPMVRERNKALIWTPDDMHLILKELNESAPDLIYHVETAVLEEWPWQCDRIASSPKSGRLATWCISANNDTSFAVIEWGGDIWYSDVPPQTELVQFDASMPIHWAWSSDGNNVAYYDPQDEEGHLIIADATGIQFVGFPGAAWWTTDQTELSFVNKPKRLLQWSQDGNRLLLHAHSIPGQSNCPLWFNENVLSEEKTFAVPCWQLMDTNNKTIIWSLSDSISEISTLHYEFPGASLAPSGETLSMSAWDPGLYKTVVVYLTNNHADWLEGFSSDMRWALEP